MDELGVKADKITVVNNGVDLSTLQPLTEEEKIARRSRFGVKPDTYVIAEVARINYVKGQHLLVRAVDALAMGCPVVRSDSPGHTDMKEIVRVCRKNDLESMIEHLEYAITHREQMQQMAMRGREEVQKRFTKEATCDETFRVYRRIRGE